MAAVTAQADPLINRILLRKIRDDLPCIVLGAIVYKQHLTFRVYQPLLGKVLQLRLKKRRSDRQDLLLIIARHNDIQNRCFHSLAPLLLMR